MSDKNIEDILANLDRLLEEGVPGEHDEADDDSKILARPASSDSGLSLNDKITSLSDSSEGDREPDRQGGERKPKRRILLTEDMLVEDPSLHS